MYIGSKNKDFYFASEEHSLKTLSCNNIEQLLNDYKVVDIPSNKKHVEIKNFENPRLNLVPELLLKGENEKLLQYPSHNLKGVKNASCQRQCHL